MGKDMAPGTIVLQKIDNCRFFVGVVVDNHMMEAMKDEVEFFGMSEEFKRAQVSYPLENALSTYHLCLVLGYFGFDDEPRTTSIFKGEKKEERYFPYYAVGKKSYAEPMDLNEEIKCFRVNITETSPNKELISELRDKAFGFSEKQKEILLMATHVRYYMRGGDMHVRSTWFYMLLGEEKEEMLFAELRKAIPRS